MYRYRLLALFLLSISYDSCFASFNRSLFYRTSSFWGEPRFVRSWLSTLDVQLLGGSNHRARNCSGNRVNLTSLYGAEDLVALSHASPDHPLVLPQNPDKICFRAVADLFEADFNLYQNFAEGWFIHFHFPLVVLRICPSGFVEDHACLNRPQKNYIPAWEHPLNELSPFLKQHKLTTKGSDAAAPSDSTLFIGWSYSYQETSYFDFIDTTIKTGVLFPTGRKADIDEIFSIPYGYNGHWGIPFSFDLSLGAFDWLTLGYHIDTVFFINKNRCLRMRRAEEAPHGLIILGKGTADVSEGTVWRMGAYAKADHVCNGLSLIFAFSYEQQNGTAIHPTDTTTFNAIHVNKDQRFQKWARSMFHFLVEYDFARENSVAGARFGIFVDLEMTGLRTFNINTTGGYLGLDCTWAF